MNPQIKSFIERHIEEIENNQWEDIYRVIPVTWEGEFTELLLYAGINPALYLEKIPDNFIQGSSIPQFIIPSNIKEIGIQSFQHCENLTEMVIPDSVKIIKGPAFYACNELEKLVIGDGVEYIGECAFEGCNLKDLTLGEGIKEISNSAFRDNPNLKELTYKGTKEQWKNIKIASNSFKITRLTHIHCSDGDLLNWD